MTNTHPEVQQIEKYSIQYLNSEISEREYDALVRELIGGTEKDIEAFKSFILTNYYTELVEKRFDSEKAYRDFLQRTGKRNVPVFNINRVQKIFKYVAILVFFVSVATIYIRMQTPQMKRLTVPTGQMASITLTDGTHIRLNSKTKLRYPDTFKGNKRKVFLNGEAFFEVSHNPEKPFVVELPSGAQITVIGTSFNIKAYSEDTQSETTLFTGKIDVSNPENKNQKLLLTPGQKLIYDNIHQKSSVIKLKELDPVIAWQHDELVFVSVRLQDIANALQRKFNTQIEIKNPELQNMIFTASFKKNLSLNEILENLKLSGNFDCKMTTNNKWIITM